MYNISNYLFLYYYTTTKYQLERIEVKQKKTYKKVKKDKVVATTI